MLLNPAPDELDRDMRLHSKEEIVWAGRVIAGRRDWTAENEAELVRAFAIAHDWRTLHARPMQRVRAGLSGKVARLDAGAALTAGRLKRMQSIRKKLQRSGVTLYQMQDIAGCRAIVESVDSARALADHFRTRGGYRVRRETDYIAQPKPDGYRSHHLMLDFDVEAPVRDPLRVELQVRTRLQHAWATAVEAVGAVSGDELKAGRGDPLWLRFFTLMSGAIAADEGGAPVPGVPSTAEELRSELINVDRQLDAVRKLESYSFAIREVDLSNKSTGMSFLIEYDNIKREVSVSRWSKFSPAASAYEQAELRGGQTLDAVLVEVDRFEDLKSAYPNYFLDVGLFVSKLKQYLAGDEHPAEAVPAAPNSGPAPAWRGRKVDLAWWFGTGADGT